MKNNRLNQNSVKYIDDNATVLVRYDDGDKFTTTTGKAMKGWSDNKKFESTVLANKDGGTDYAKLIYVNLGKSTSVPGGADTLYAYLFDGPEFVDAENDYREYEAWNGTEDVKVKILDSEEGAQLDEGTVIEYTLDADGFASVDNKWEPKDFTTGAIIGGELADDLTGSVEFAGNKVFDIDEDDDPIVLFVDMDGDAGAVMTDWRTAIENDNGTWVDNAVYVTENATNLKVIVVDAGDNDLSVSGVYKAAQGGTTVVKYTASVADDANKNFTTVKISVNKTENLKKGDKVTVSLEKTDGNKFGQGTYSITVDGASAPEAKKVTDDNTSKITFEVTVGTSNIVVTGMAKA